MPSIIEVVGQAYTVGWSGDTQDAMRMVQSLVPEHNVDDIKAEMARIDPDRHVWDRPPSPGETGLGGQPLLGARYRLLSNRYGHEVEATADADPAFVRAIRRGYDNAVLHDLGHAAVDLETGRFGFLVLTNLEGDALECDDYVGIPMAEFREMSRRLGIDVVPMAYPATTLLGQREPGRMVATALVTDIAGLALVPDIAQAIDEADVRAGQRATERCAAALRR